MLLTVLCRLYLFTGHNEGDFHMVALSKRREVFSWGYGAEGQGGHGNLLHMRTPRRVNSLQDVPIAQVKK